MKKILNLLVVLLLTIPTIALADMGMPEFREYEAIIINETNCYDSDFQTPIFSIPAQTKIKVSYEYKEKGKIYGSATLENDQYCYIDLEDITAVDKDFDPSEYTKVDNKYYVLTDDLYLKKGPAQAYKNTTSTPIPKGTILKSMYASFDIWEYVTYDGIAGWIEVNYSILNNISSSKIASYSEKNLKLMNFQEGARLYSDLDGENPLNVSIPAGKILTYKTYIPNYAYLVTYNNIQGWYLYNPEKTMLSSDRSLLILDSKKVNLYDKPFSLGKKIENVKLKDLDIIKIDYIQSIETNDAVYDNWYSITYKGTIYYINNKSGYDIKDMPLVESIWGQKYYYYYTETDFKAYKNYKDLSKFENQKGKAYIATNFSLYYDNLEYVYVEGLGFIDITYDKHFFKKVEKEDIPNDATIYGLNPGEKITTTVQTTTKAETKPNKKSSVKLIFIGLISGIVVLALTIIVIIVLINKKKNKKSKEEIVTNQEVVTNVEGKTTDEIK